MAFAIKRGTDISHWLSQSDRRGDERAAWFTQNDVTRIAQMGFDHIRLPLDEVQLWSESGAQEPEAFDLLDAALDWCEQAGLRVVVDLHITRGHFFNDATQPRLFTDAAELNRFISLWRQLSERLCHRSTEQVAYEILNEPKAVNPEDWNRVSSAVFQVLRALEAERTIILGSNWYNDTDTFDQLAVPKDDHCILTFHYYKPMLITHHQASWWPGGAYAGPVQYPGVPVPNLTAFPQALAASLPDADQPNKVYNRDQILADLQKPLAVQKQTGLPLYCGEFGCYEKTPQAVRLAWYRDVIGLFKEYGIGWANWDYKGGFGIIKADGGDTGIAAVLLG